MCLEIGDLESSTAAYSSLDTRWQCQGVACHSPIGESCGMCIDHRVAEVLTSSLSGCRRPVSLEVWGWEDLGSGEQILPERKGEAGVGLITEFIDQGTYLLPEGSFHTLDSQRKDIWVFALFWSFLYVRSHASQFKVMREYLYTLSGTVSCTRSNHILTNKNFLKLLL